MPEPRSPDEHAALFVEFGNRVSRLTPEAWDRLSSRCAALNGPDFRALLARTALAVSAHKLSIPAPLRDRLSLRIIAGASRAVITSIFFAYELAVEFDTPDSSAPVYRPASTGKPHIDACVNAYALIETALASRIHAQPGVAAAVRAASRVVLLHDWLASEDFEAVYKYIEPDIPFAELQKR
ncbi:MAG TPA: hypothetical protein VII52_02390 [Gemmatimonadaceae bacterium]